MSDLDDELLALAGGDSDEEVDDLDRFDQTQVFEERSPSQDAQQSVEKTEEPQTSKRGVAQKVKSRAKRKRKQENEDEDGEAPPSPDASIISGGMEESEGEIDAASDDEVEEDDGRFPVEGKFHSKSDRDHIMSLPELEREAILADRAEQLAKKRQDAMLKKALAANSAKQQKRKAGAADLEDGNRRTTRPKTDKRSALDDYRRAREQKDAERNRVDARRDLPDERPASSASDRDADGESEVEWAEPASDGRRDEPPGELKDFERCRVGRSNFAQICFYPGFEDTVKGCFARVSIGMNRQTGQNQYRMTQIRGFTEGKPYQLENAHGKNFMTDQYAIVAQGSEEKPWPFSACSDGKITEGEFSRYIETLGKENARLSSRNFLQAKLDSIHQLLNQKFTEETLQIKFANQRAMELKFDPVYVAKQKRRNIIMRRSEAGEAGDEEEVARCDAELEALENSGSASNGAIKAKPGPVKQFNQERLALLNQSNRRKTQQEVRQALIAERKKLLKERQAVAEKKTAENKGKVEAKMLRPEETLRKAAMKDLFGETPDGSRAGTPASGIDTPKHTQTGTGQTPIGSKKGPIGALKQRNLDDDVIAGLDLNIDLDF